LSNKLIGLTVSLQKKCRQAVVKCVYYDIIKEALRIYYRMDVCHKIKSSSPLSLPRPLARPFSLSFVSIIDPAHSLTPQAPSIHGRIKPSRPHATFIGVLSIQKLWNTKPKINV